MNITNIALILNLILIIWVVFVERKKPQTTIAWVLVIAFIPVFGGLLYILLGGHKISGFSLIMRKNRLRCDEYFERIEKSLKRRYEAQAPPESCADIIKMHERMGKRPLSSGNSVLLYTRTEEKYADLFKDIENAKETINIEYFIIRSDNTGRRLVELLEKKASEGVEVRLLYDEFGAVRTKIHFFWPVVRAGGRVSRFFHSKTANILRTNHRNHRKIAVIDGRIGYVGGINIGDEYLGLDKKRTPWRDTHIRIEGTAVHALQTRFLTDWFFSSREEFDFTRSEIFEKFYPKIETKGSAVIQIVSSGPDVPQEQIKFGYFKIINNAKKYVYIQTPYFVPDDDISDAIKIAAASGVDVRLMIPGMPDHKYVYELTKLYARELLEWGVRVYLYRGFMHAKAVVSDGCVCSIGSANFDVRSFSLNFETGAFIYDEEIAAKYTEIFFEDAKMSDELKEQAEKRSVFRHMAESIYRLIAPLV